MSFLAAGFGTMRLSAITLTFKSIQVIGHDRLWKLSKVFGSTLVKKCDFEANFARFPVNTSF